MKNIFIKKLVLIVLYIISAILLYPILSYFIIYDFRFLKYLPEIPYQWHIQVLFSSPLLLIIGIYLIKKHKSYNRVIGIVLSGIAIVWFLLMLIEIIIAYP